MEPTFLIKHRSGGKYFHPDGGEANPKENTYIVLCSDIHERMFWTFEKIVDQWGYIKHVKSGMIIHPDGGSLNPEKDTRLVLSGDRHWGALFALDETNNQIIHKGGKIAHPEGDRANPKDQTRVVLNSDINDAIRFQFVATDSPNKEVFVYDKPMVIGTWKIIHMVLNPIAEHSQTIKTKVGRSETESSKSAFKYKWEMSADALIEIVNVSVSESFGFTLTTMSSKAWSTEETVERTIKVSPGKSVVTWQFVLAVSQNENKSVFHSDRFADTESPKKVPEVLQ